jgi:hypothetical protein
MNRVQVTVRQFKSSINDLAKEDLSRFDLVSNMVVSTKRYLDYYSMSGNRNYYGFPEVMSASYQYLAFMNWIASLGNLLAIIESYFSNLIVIPDELDKQAYYCFEGELEDKQDKLNSGKSRDNHNYISVRDRLYSLRNRFTHGNQNVNHFVRAHLALLYEDESTTMINKMKKRYRDIHRQLVQASINYLDSLGVEYYTSKTVRSFVEGKW